MSNFVSLEEAAKLLGMAPKQLNDLRLKNEIFATKDGKDWKFRRDEVERFAHEQGISLGKPGDELGLESDEIGLLDDSAELVEGSSQDVLEDDSEELTFGSSDIQLAAASSGNVLSGDEPKSGSPSDTDKMNGDGDEPQLDEDELFDDELMLQDSASFEDSSEVSSDYESSELLLDESDSDSEVELDSVDTGINLGPTESGISLEEEPLELGGSDIDSLELPEDDEIMAADDSQLSDSSTDFGNQDDDFNLTPLEDSQDEDMSSGSQVIALEDSAIYTDDAAPTMIGDEGAAQPAVAADTGYGEAAAYAAGEVGVIYAPPEAPYSIWNVVSLALALASMTLLTIVTVDLARNMWQPEGVTLSNSTVNFFLRAFGYDV